MSFGYALFVVPGLLCGFEDSGGAVEGLRELGKLCVGASGVRLADGLVDSWNDDGSIAGVFAGSVDGVLVPGAMGKPFRIQERGLRVAQGAVETGRVGGWGELAIPDGSPGRFETMGSFQGRRKVERQMAGGGAPPGVFEVACDLFAVELIVVGQDIGVGHVKDLETEDASLLLLVDEGGIGEFGEPVVVVKDGVVYAVGTFRPDVGGGHAKMLEEGSVVGAGAEVPDANVFFA